MSLDQRMQVMMPEDEKRAAERAAAEGHMSLSSWVRQAIREKLSREDKA